MGKRCYDFGMKKIIFAVLLLFFSASCLRQTADVSPASLPGGNYNHRLNIASKTLLVEIANTPAAMQQGLSGRDAMQETQGMLFDFGTEKSSAPFWMKDMEFDLDFIWIKNNRIIFITQNAPGPKPGTPDNQLTLYSPPEQVDEVLEVNAGWVKKNNIAVGDVVSLQD